MDKYTFDDNPQAIFNPADIVEKINYCPKIAVSVFANNLIENALKKYPHHVVAYLKSANGKLPFYCLKIGTYEIGLIMAQVGAPTLVFEYEELFALGVEKLVVFGTCGVLDANIKDCSIIVPNIAIRDEGTSYHYVKAGHEIAVNVKRFDDLLAFLKMKKINYTVGKVWSNDAIYRETVNKVKIRKEQGCICVDMECSAIAALAKFRDYEITQFFYSADNLGSENYELRSLDNEEKIDQKNTIVDLAIEFAIYLLDK